MEQTLEVRSVEVRSVDEETRTVTGIAVPYGQVTDIGGYKERFEKGAFGDAQNVKLFYGHSEPIGLVTKGTDTDEGFLIEARISKTERGNEVYELLKDGVLNRFSVGFLPVEHRMEKDVVVRTKADLKEVSVVAFPAYEGAEVNEVRNQDSEVRSDSENSNKEEETIMENDYAKESDVADLRNAVEDIERRFAVIGERGSDKNESGMQFRNGGEFLKALASGSQEARDFATTADADVTRPAWVNQALRLKDANRPLINTFDKGALPATGNSIEVPVIASVTGTVGKQAAEGADLPYMEVVTTNERFDIETYGGYSSLSRQAIERSDIAYLATVLENQVRQYAKATEKAVRDALVAATGTGTGAVTADEADAWIDAVVDASDYIEANAFGAKPSVAIASPDVYKRLAHMVDGQGRPLFSIAGQNVNGLGEANIVTGSLNVGGLNVVKNVDLAANTFYVVEQSAVKTFESAGAPFRLQDENIINLTKDFSVYGYLSVAVMNPNAIVKVDVDLA